MPPFKTNVRFFLRLLYAAYNGLSSKNKTFVLVEGKKFLCAENAQRNEKVLIFLNILRAVQFQRLFHRLLPDQTVLCVRLLYHEFLPESVQ